jgi:hypothetical protein
LRQPFHRHEKTKPRRPPLTIRHATAGPPVCGELPLASDGDAV